MEIPEEACAPETDIDTDSDSEATAITIQKPKHVQEWFIIKSASPNQLIGINRGNENPSKVFRNDKC